MSTTSASANITPSGSEVDIRVAGVNSGHVDVKVKNGPSTHTTELPGQVTLFVSGDKNSCVKADVNSSIGGNSSNVTLGYNFNRSGTNIRIVGGAELFQNNPADQANKALLNVTATKSATPTETPSLGIVSTLASAPASLMRGFSSCIKPTQSKVLYKPTGNLLVDIEGLMMFYYERLSELSIANIAQRAILLVLAEADRIEKQFLECMDANIDWITQSLSSLSSFAGIGSAVSPSTQSSRQNIVLDRKQMQKETAKVIPDVIRAERQGG